MFSMDMTTPPIARREVLAAIGVTATAGCTSSIPGFSTDEVVLGSVRVANESSETAEIILRVETSEASLFEDTVEVDSMEREMIDEEWPSEATEYTITYAGEGSIQRFELPADAEPVDGSCLDVHIHQLPGEVAIHFWDDNPSWGGCQ